jgi:mannose-6-phosphate isomerase-like protein (cupin superfamily)
MKYRRIYCDDAGDSHFEDVSVKLSPVEFAPPAPPLNLAAPIDSERMILFSVPAGWVGDWHPTPCPQFYIQLSGELEIQVGDGEIRKFSAGSIILVEDTSGKGHVSRNQGNSEVNAVFIQLSAGSKEAV